MSSHPCPSVLDEWCPEFWFCPEGRRLPLRDMFCFGRHWPLRRLPWVQMYLFAHLLHSTSNCERVFAPVFNCDFPAILLDWIWKATKVYFFVFFLIGLFLHNEWSLIFIWLKAIWMFSFGLADMCAGAVTQRFGPDTRQMTCQCALTRERCYGVPTPRRILSLSYCGVRMPVEDSSTHCR